MVVGDDDAGTPAERLMYALGQLYRLHHRGELAVQPARFDVLDLARIIGVRRDIHAVTDDPTASAYFFGAAGQVLAVVPADPFPFRVVSMREWDAWLDARDLIVGLDDHEQGDGAERGA